MAKSAVLFAFVLLTILTSEAMANYTTPTCPNNQEYSTCGTACPLTCLEPNERPCTLQCVRGCFCKAPKVLDEASGECVELEDCPTDITPTCPINQEYLTCGSACPKTCSEPIARICTKQCARGCFCKAPKVLDEASGECVELEDCPADTTPACPHNQEYLTCGTACPETCKKTYYRPPICTLQCVSGCFCKAPKVLDEASGKCVDKKDCPAGY